MWEPRNLLSAETLASAQKSAGALQRRCDAVLPSGALAGLVRVVKQKLASGLAAEQIAKALAELESPRPCAEHVTRKSFGRGGRAVVKSIERKVFLFPRHAPASRWGNGRVAGLDGRGGRPSE